MKDEIKEIFNINELFEEWKQFLSWCYENNDKTVEIHRDKLKWVMDYITNLQKENKQLKEDKKKAIECIKNRNTTKSKKERFMSGETTLEKVLAILGDKENEV